MRPLSDFFAFFFSFGFPLVFAAALAEFFPLRFVSSTSEPDGPSSSSGSRGSRVPSGHLGEVSILAEEVGDLGGSGKGCFKKWPKHKLPDAVVDGVAVVDGREINDSMMKTDMTDMMEWAKHGKTATPRFQSETKKFRD